MWQDHQEAEGVIRYRQHRFCNISERRSYFTFVTSRCSTYWRGISRRFLVNLYGYKSVKGRFCRGYDGIERVPEYYYEFVIFGAGKCLTDV